MKKLLRRLREPSTWAGIGILLGVFGLQPELITEIQTVGEAAVALVVAGAAVYATAKGDRDDRLDEAEEDFPPADFLKPPRTY